MIGLISSGGYLHALQDGDTLPALDAQLAELCREPIRRIDRFVQLALLGSARCALNHALDPDCALYLASSLGPLSANISVQEQLLRDRQLPKPFDFINTLGSSAGFYAARNLGLHGQNFFIARGAASFEAALLAALADLGSGAIRQALVGGVEEVTLPLPDYRQRLGLPAGATVAEASHWLLLDAQTRTASITLELHRYVDFSALQNALRTAWRASDGLHCARSMRLEQATRLHENFAAAGSFGSDGGCHNTLASAWLVESLTQAPQAQLFLVDGADARGWTLIYCRT